MDAQDVSEGERGEGQLLVSEEATASAGISISPTDMEGKAVTLVNENEQVRWSPRSADMEFVSFSFCDSYFSFCFFTNSQKN